MMLPSCCDSIQIILYDQVIKFTRRSIAAHPLPTDGAGESYPLYDSECQILSEVSVSLQVYSDDTI